MSTLDKIIAALDVPVQDFFNFEIDLAKNNTTDVINKLNYILKDFDHKDQTVIYNLVKDIVSFKNQR